MGNKRSVEKWTPQNERFENLMNLAKLFAVIAYDQNEMFKMEPQQQSLQKQSQRNRRVTNGVLKFLV